MLTDDQFPAMRAVTLWVALEPNGKCGMWFKEEQDARAAMLTFPTLVPVEVPGTLYAGIGIGAPLTDEDIAERRAIQGEPNA